ncbi:hypothetical protein [Rhodocista pekingensis]|uniref:Peptidase M48 domain-containing protein n=1 Tax=Rhodocista pekingensis TaxID=201185 RepID=A0ABW2KQY9_9PROT
MNDRQSLQDHLVETVQAFLKAANNDASEARKLLSGLAPVLRGRVLFDTLADVVSGDRHLHSLAANLHVIGPLSERGNEILVDTLSRIAKFLDRKSPFIIVNIGQDGKPARIIQEVAGISLIEFSPQDLSDPGTVAHELAHAFALSDHRALDEGFATYVEYLVATGSHDAACAELSRSAAEAPSLDSLLAHRWRDRPCFEGMPGSHALAGLLAGRLLERMGTSAFLQMISSVREAKVEDARPLIANSLGIPLHELSGLLASVATTGRHGTKIRPSPLQFHRIRTSFLLGQTDGLAAEMGPWREYVLANPDDDDAAVHAVMLALLARTVPDQAEEAARFPLEAVLDGLRRRLPHDPVIFALCLAWEGAKAQTSTSYLALRDCFARARAIAEAALDQFPRSCDVLVAVAKLELQTPVEYGGSRGRAANLLTRAAAVAPWPDVAAILAGTAERLASPLEIS